MANQGCPNEGSDERLFGKIGCWIQSQLSFHSTNPPKERVWRIETTYVFRLPPYVAVIVPLPSKDGKPRWLSFRAGWRWDPHWAYKDGSGRSGGYIFPEAILKIMDHVVF